MIPGLEALAERPYPGRFIVLGENDAGAGVVVYGITGRSPPSQARRLVIHGEPRSPRVEVEVTDTEVLRTGKPELLVYPAMISSGTAPTREISVSNGAQTATIAEHWGFTALEALQKGHAKWEYEPDIPNFTPRISGRLNLFGDRNKEAFLGIIRRGTDVLPRRAFYEVPLTAGRGEFISTYDGQDCNPVQPFRGEPLAVAIPGATPEQTARYFYEAFAPAGEKDFRVSVACMYLSRENNLLVGIVNRF
ncbi:MAG: IMP cyclohydrolase [Nanoarchaeota archaeon]